MAVIAASHEFGLRRRTPAVDGHGTPTAGVLGPAGWWKPGRVVSRGGKDGKLDTGPAGWVLALDASWWPIAAGDQVVTRAGEAWTVVAARVLRSDFDAGLDYIRAEVSPAAG